MELNNSNPYVDKDIRLLLLTILDSDFAFAFTLTGLASTRQEHNEPAETIRAYAESTAAGIERLLDLADVLTEKDRRSVLGRLKELRSALAPLGYKVRG